MLGAAGYEEDSDIDPAERQMLGKLKNKIHMKIPHPDVCYRKRDAAGAREERDRCGLKLLGRHPGGLLTMSLGQNGWREVGYLRLGS